ncbi:MAG: hypothetical protein F4Y57_06430, partial [Acidobacteria bacterium]|nr:hypothetical protein [Acidobacteriota bacterium]
MKRLCAVAVLASVAAFAPIGAQQGSGGLVEWPYVGFDQGHTKYSQLAGIDSTNVDQLEIAWRGDPNA